MKINGTENVNPDISARQLQWWTLWPQWELSTKQNWPKNNIW